MTDYADETVTVRHTVTDLDDEIPLTPGMVDHVSVRIFTTDFATELVTETNMSWDASLEEWQYKWMPDASGTYKAVCYVYGLAGEVNFEVKRFRVARNPVPA